MTHWQVRRTFPRDTLLAIEQAIAASETTHIGQLQFAVEGALSLAALVRGLTARERAIEVFSQLHVWDTEHNNGVLIYLCWLTAALRLLPTVESMRGSGKTSGMPFAERWRWHSAAWNINVVSSKAYRSSANILRGIFLHVRAARMSCATSR